MDYPLVSIIVPVYNTADYVEECIQSILSQSYKYFELILVNDGSTDGSGDICRKYETPPYVLYVEQNNSGTTAARRKGVELAHGEWLLFVDSDDYLLDDAVSNMVAIAGDSDIVIGGHDGYLGLDWYGEYIDSQEYWELIYARQITVSPCAKLYKKELFHEKTLSFSRHFILGEDYLMNVQIAVDNNRLVRVNHTPVYFRRSVPTSTVHTHNLTFDYCKEICGLADEIVKDAMGKKWPLLQMKQRMVFFNLTLPDVQYHSDAHHPFILGIKCCMDEAGVWRPMDRLLLSVSSPRAIKTVLKLRSICMRLEHPSMIMHDLKRFMRIY